MRDSGYREAYHDHDAPFVRSYHLQTVRLSGCMQMPGTGGQSKKSSGLRCERLLAFGCSAAATRAPSNNALQHAVVGAR